MCFISFKAVRKFFLYHFDLVFSYIYLFLYLSLDKGLILETVRACTSISIDASSISGNSFNTLYLWITFSYSIDFWRFSVGLIVSFGGLGLVVSFVSVSILSSSSSSFYNLAFSSFYATDYNKRAVISVISFAYKFHFLLNKKIKIIIFN